MKAVVLSKTGGPEVLGVSDVPEPVPGEGEVLVKNEFIGINYAEILSRKGLYSWAVERPYIPGMESSGVVEKVGKKVDTQLVGKRVVVGAKYGTYAEKVSVPYSQTVPCPPSFSMEESAAYIVNFLTAWVLLFKMARINSEDKVLVTAAAGGVGTAAVKLAEALGCEVYGMAGSGVKFEYIRSNGAIDVFSYSDDKSFRDLIAVSGGIDVVIELVGGDVFRKSVQCLNPFGRVCVGGFASLDLNKLNPFSWIKTWMDIPRVDIGRLSKNSIGVMSCHVGYLLDRNPEMLMDIYNEMTGYITKNSIKPFVCRVFSLDECAEAHRFIESRKSCGKVLLKL